jgi:hypothetical protein
MSGDEIYKWHVERNLPVPKHFQGYKAFVEEQEVGDCIRNNNIAKLRKIDPDIIKNLRRGDSLQAACSVSLEIVKVLHEDMGLELTQACLVEASKAGNMDIIKYLTSKGLLPTATGCHYGGRGGNTAYSMAAQHSQKDVLEYFEAEFQIPESVRLGALFDTKPESPTIHIYVSQKIDSEVIQLYYLLRTDSFVAALR